MTHDPWTPELHQRLKAMVVAGAGTFEIAVTLGLSRGAVKARIAKLRHIGELPHSTRGERQLDADGEHRGRDNFRLIARMWAEGLRGRRYDRGTCS